MSVSPFTLLSMARRATNNFRQMSYNAANPPAPATPAIPASTSDDTSDTASIKSETRKRAAPGMQVRRAPAAVVDNVTVTSLPPSSPPPAKTILSDVASNGSSETLAQEPTASTLVESPKMEGEPKVANDYFSLRKSSGSKDPSPDVGALEQEKRRLTEQVRVITSEKERLAGELKRVSGAKDHLLQELKEKEERWDAERAGLMAEGDNEKGRAEAERVFLVEKVDGLAAENKSLSQEKALLVQEKEDLVREKVLLVQEKEGLTQEKEGLAREKEGLERARAELQERVVGLESILGEKAQAYSDLEIVVSSLEKEKAGNDRTIGTLQQNVVAAREDFKVLQAQSMKEIEAAAEKNERLSQQAKKEKEKWEAERVRLGNERAEEQRRVEEEKEVLDQRITTLESAIDVKEKATKRLEDELSFVRREKEESGQAVVGLQQQLTVSKDAMKKLQDSAAVRMSALQNDFDRLREERDEQLSSKNDYIHSLNVTLDGLRNELVYTRTTMEETISQNKEAISQLQAGLSERDTMLEELETEKNSLRQHLIALGDELAEKEQARRALSEDMAYLEREKDERGRTVASLQEQLELAAGEMKLLRDTTSAKTAGLEEELRRVREERDQGPCTIM